MSPKTYAQLIYEVLGDKLATDQDKILHNFKNILIRNKESYLAQLIEKEFIKIQEQKEEEKTAYISSASKLTTNQKKALKNIATEPREFSVNPDLLGGVAMRNKDIIHNATVRKKVEVLRGLSS